MTDVMCGAGRRPNNALPRGGLVRHNGFRSVDREGPWMKMMKKLLLWLCLLIATLAAGQAKKGSPMASGSQAKKGAPAGSVASTAAAKICDDPYQVREPADGWPEVPIQILFHHENSKAPWAK